MNRAVGTGRPSASTLASESRPGSSPARSPPTVITIVHVPDETTVNGGSARLSHGSSEAFESWMPQTTGVAGSIPVAAATLPRIGPSIWDAGSTGGNRGSQPSAATRVERRPPAGDHRSVWQPSEVSSLAMTPESRHAQYCG